MNAQLGFGGAAFRELDQRARGRNASPDLRQRCVTSKDQLPGIRPAQFPALALLLSKPEAVLGHPFLLDQLDQTAVKSPNVTDAVPQPVVGVRALCARDQDCTADRRGDHSDQREVGIHGNGERGRSEQDRRAYSGGKAAECNSYLAGHVRTLSGAAA